MPADSSFPFFIHVITIPITLAVGFFLGWVFRGAAERRNRNRTGTPAA